MAKKIINPAARLLLQTGVPTGSPVGFSGFTVRTQRVPMGRSTQDRGETANTLPRATMAIGPGLFFVPAFDQLLFEAQPETWRALFGVPLNREVENGIAHAIRAEAIADGLVDDEDIPAVAAA